MSVAAEQRPPQPRPPLFEPFDKAMERHRARLKHKSAPDRIEWLRRVTRAYAADLRLHPLLGEGDIDANADEIAEAVFGFARRIGATQDEADAAARAVITDARESALATVDHLRRGLWKMAAAKAPAELLMAEARRIANRHEGFLPDHLLAEAGRQTVIAAAPKQGRSRRGR